MAASGTALRLCARTISRPRPLPRLPLPPATPRHTLLTTQRRTLTTTTPRRRNDDDADATLGGGDRRDISLTEEFLESLPQEQRTRELERGLQRLHSKLDADEKRISKELDAKAATLFKEPPPLKDSFWFDEEDEDTMTHGIDGENFDEDDITSVAHGKLDELREQRHYARVIAWEMPLLSKLAKPFVPPTEEQVLRFRYTTYMGEQHPAQRKVVVTFCPADLGLTPQQELKLKKLAGVRYNPDKDMVKMSCESFEHQAQNKRYLSDQVNTLIEAAKDPTDTFEDIPLDLRHHISKQKPKFPVEWRMTEARRKELDEIRAAAEKRDAEGAEEGRLVDGTEIVKGYLADVAHREAQKEKVAELLGVKPGKGAKGARMRR